MLAATCGLEEGPLPSCIKVQWILPSQENSGGSEVTELGCWLWEHSDGEAATVSFFRGISIKANDRGHCKWGCWQWGSPFSCQPLSGATLLPACCGQQRAIWKCSPRLLSGPWPGRPNLRKSASPTLPQESCLWQQANHFSLFPYETMSASKMKTVLGSYKDLVKICKWMNKRMNN